VNGWNELLSHLAEVPRENGTPAVHQAASYLVDAFRATGIEAQRLPYTAHPYETRFLGLFVLAVCVLYFFLAQRKRFLTAGLLSLLIPVVVVLDVEFGLPLFGGLRAERQENIMARIPTRSSSAKQRLIFTAHYDTKTDLFDHVVRAPIQVVGFPLCGLMIVAAFTGLAARIMPSITKSTERLAKLVGMAALLYGPAFVLAFSAGAVLPVRSPGALDDGAACAVLIRAAAELGQAPPLEQTDVEIILFSGEELGAEGSARYVKARFSERDMLPSYVINLDPIGASSRLAVTGDDRRLFRSYRPDPRIVAGLGSVFRQITGSPLSLTSRGGTTDAVSFEARGIPAATLISEVPPFIIPRGMHTAMDKRSRIDLSSLDLTKELIVRFAREADANGMKF
jgi:hypothetical protein